MKKLTYHIIGVLFGCLIGSCIPSSEEEISLDDNSEVFRGTERDIKDLYGEATIDSLRSLGLVINEGSTPPNLDGVYMTDAMVLEDTNIANDREIGFEFANLRFAISKQNNDSLTLDFSGFDVTNRISSTESFISGSGNRFTVYLRVISDNEPTGSVGVFAYVFSGTKTTNGIENFSYGLMMVDDSGDLADIYIDNNEGRRFTDKDGFVEQWTTIENRRFNGTLSSLSTILSAPAIQQLRALGTVVHEGQNPPELSGSYQYDPVLAATTRGEKDANLIFEDFFDISFTNQNNNLLEVQFDAKEFDTPNQNFDWWQGVKSFISGSDDRFTVYSLIFEYDANLTYQPLYLCIWSGRVTQSNQITNLTYGLYMINNGGTGDGFYIDNGDARSFYGDISSINKIPLSTHVNSKSEMPNRVSGLLSTMLYNTYNL